MCCDGFISVPVIDNPVNTALDVTKNINDTVTNAVDNAGTVLDDTVNNTIPGGWATVGAAALAAATYGGSLAAEGAVGAGEGLAAAPELDATGSMAEQAAASQAASAGAGAGAGAGVGAGTEAGTVAGAGLTDTGAQLGSSTLGSGGSGLGLGTGTVSSGTGLGGLTSASTVPIGSTGFSTDALLNAALTGAGKGALTNVAVDAITGQPITPQGVATGALTGAVGGGAGNVAGQLGAGTIGSGIAGGGAGGATGALVNNGDVGRSALTGALTGGISGATNQALTGQDPSIVASGQSVASNLTNSILNNAPINPANLIGGALASAGLTSGTNALLNSSTPTTSNPDDAFNKALVNAIQNPMDTSQNPSGLVAGDGTGIPSVLIGNDVLSSTQELTQQQQYEKLMQEPGMDSATASELSGYTPSNDTTVVVPTSVPSNQTNPVAQQNNTAGALTQQAGDAVNTNLSGQIGGLSSGLDTTNKTIAENQAQTEEQLNNLSDAQKSQVASQVAMGVSLTAAINSVQSSLLKQSTDASNAQIQSSALSNNQAQSQPGSGNIPTPISGQTLAGAPVYNTNTQILQQLQQLDPKLLSKIAPHLANTNLTQSGLSALASPQQSNTPQSDPYASLMQTMLSSKDSSKPSSGLSNTLMSSGLSALNGNVPGYKKGGSIQHNEQDKHVPEFITGSTGHYVKGKGDGQSDDIPAMLADGEYVFDADTVAQLGNGSSDAGAKLLDHFRESLREHKRSAPSDKIPPAASPLAYMKEALKRHSKG